MRVCAVAGACPAPYTPHTNEPRALRAWSVEGSTVRAAWSGAQRATTPKPSCGKTAFEMRSAIRALSPERRQAMRGVCWREEPGCPAFDVLRVVAVEHWTFAAATQRGELVVHERVADEVVAIFEELHAARFPVESVLPIERFDGDDERSMAANNASAFNYRLIAGTNVPSHHGLGLAIDVNPRQNPWVRGDVVLPVEGRSFLDRRDVRPGMIVEGGVALAAFERRGWDWGGRWTEAPDYHHFSKLRRGAQA